MARLIRIQFKVDEFNLSYGVDTIYLQTKTGVSNYNLKSLGVKNLISNSKAAFYLEFPQPPHAHSDSKPYTDFAVSIVGVFHKDSVGSVVVDTINVVETNRNPDTPSTEQELDSLFRSGLENHTIEEIVASPTIISGPYVRDNGARYNDGTSRRVVLYNVTYNELSSMPVINDPGETWVNPSSLISYSISNSLVGCTTSNDTTSVNEGSSYSATITASTGYHFEVSDVTITMGGNTITPTFAADYKSFTISIASVTSSVSISATATYDTPVSTYYTITNELTQCTTNNAATQVPEGSSYSAKLTANAGYYFYTGNVVITMGSTTITPTLNKNGSYNVSIAEVTGNVVITALASAEAPTPSVWSARWDEIPTPNSSFDVVSSSIHQTAEKIELKVSSEDLVSTLNSQLTIQSNLIHLYSDGKIVIEGDNFNLDANGHMTAVGATLSGGNSTGASVDIESSDITFYYNDSEIGSISTSYGRHGSYYYNCIDIQASSLNLVANDTIFLTSNSGDGGVVVNGEALYVEDNYDGAYQGQKAPLSDLSVSGNPIATLSGFSFTYNSNFGYILCCDSYTQYQWDADILCGVDVDNVYRVPVWSPNKSW